MVVVAVVRSQPIEEGLVLPVIGDVDLVPHSFRPRPGAITVVEDLRMSIVNFEEPLTCQANDVTGRDGEMKIWMVNVRHHWDACPFSLFKHRIHISLHYFCDAIPALRCNECLQVRGIHVNRLAIEPVSNLLGLDDEEL